MWVAGNHCQQKCRRVINHGYPCDCRLHDQVNEDVGDNDPPLPTPHELDEYIPWHTDKHDLYSDVMDVVAMNLGAPGIYCYRPRQKGATIWPELSGKGETWRQKAIAHGF